MATERSLSITEESNGAELRLTIGGELDIGTAAELLERVNGCEVEPAGTLALDLGNVTFMDVAGMRALLEASQRCHRHDARLVIYNPRRIASRVFSLTAVDQQLEIRFDERAKGA